MRNGFNCFFWTAILLLHNISCFLTKIPLFNIFVPVHQHAQLLTFAPLRPALLVWHLWLGGAKSAQLRWSAWQGTLRYPFLKLPTCTDDVMKCDSNFGRRSRHGGSTDALLSAVLTTCDQLIISCQIGRAEKLTGTTVKIQIY